MKRRHFISSVIAASAAGVAAFAKDAKEETMASPTAKKRFEGRVVLITVRLLVSARAQPMPLQKRVQK